MSCYIVHPETVNAVANAIIDRKLEAGDIAAADVTTYGAYLVRVLADENVRSFRYRYEGSDFVEEEGHMEPYFVRRHYPMGMASALARNLNYQSCECPDYAETEACKLLKGICDLADAYDVKSQVGCGNRVLDSWGWGICYVSDLPDGGAEVVFHRQWGGAYEDGRPLPDFMMKADRVTFDAAGWAMLVERGVIVKAE